jgi:hypothetical protein
MTMSEIPARRKHCLTCNRFLALSDYHRDKSKADQHRNICKRCTLDACAVYRERNPNKAAAMYQRRVAANPDYGRERYAATRTQQLAHKARKHAADKASKELEQ